MRKGIKSIFLTGLAVVVPAGLTIYIFVFLINSMDQLFLVIPERFHPEAILGVHIPGLGVIFTLLIIFIAGLITRSYLGAKLVMFSERVLERIPVVRSVYQALKQVADSLLGDKSRSFRQVVLVEFPRKGLYSLGFITGWHNGEVERKVGRSCVSVFVPTTPNPTTGFFMMIPEEEVEALDMTIEEAFVLIMSVGVVVPGRRVGKNLKTLHNVP